MNESTSLFEQITALTGKLEIQYPEQYKFLEEELPALPTDAHPVMDKKRFRTIWKAYSNCLNII